jgi:hypothetical protein
MLLANMPSWKIKGHWCYFKVGDVSKFKKAHIHVEASRGEISFWISEKEIKLKEIEGNVNEHERNKIERIIKENIDFFLKEWEKQWIKVK